MEARQTAPVAGVAIGIAAPASAARNGWDRGRKPHAWIEIGRVKMNPSANYPQRNFRSAQHANVLGQNRFTACGSVVVT